MRRLLSPARVRSQAGALILLVTGCSFDLGLHGRLAVHDRPAKGFARAELSFATEIVAPFTPDAALAAGPGVAAWISFGAEPAVISGRSLPEAAFIDGNRHGAVLWSDGLDLIDGAVRVAHPAAGSMGAAVMATDGDTIWIAGSNLVRVAGGVVDRITIDGAQGLATALAIAEDHTAWVAFGETLHGVRVDAAGVSVINVEDLGLGVVHAMATEGRMVIAGGESAVAFRSGEGSWQSYDSLPVTHLASNGWRTWAVIGGDLAVRDGYMFAKVLIDGEGEIRALGADAIGSAIIARGNTVERWDLERREDATPLEPMQPPPPPMPPPLPAPEPSFSRDIEPWARTTCSCHFNAGGGIPVLDNAAAWRSRATLLLRRVVEQTPPVMPPPEMTNRPTDAQRAQLRSWIEGNQED